MLYAYAAIERLPYANFTPSVAADVPPLIAARARAQRAVAGKDGKTGQTFMKTVIAPALRARALHVDGWFSTNILGNRDGLALDDPNSLQSKLDTKGSVLDHILGYPVEDHIVDIRYYRPRGDDKEAWDNIDVTGFMGQRMQIKVNFLCKDSILAAPLAIEIARCLGLAERRGEGGVQEQMGLFFKAPMMPTATRRSTPSTAADAAAGLAGRLAGLDSPRDSGLRTGAHAAALLRPLLSELGDLKRIRSAGREGSIAERGCSPGLGGLLRGDAAERVMRRTVAARWRRRVSATSIARLSRRLGFDEATARGVLRAASRPWRATSIRTGDACVRCRAGPDGAPARRRRARLRRRPRAPAARRRHLPGQAAPRAGAAGEPRRALLGRRRLRRAAQSPLRRRSRPVFLAALAHHLHNAAMPDSGFTGEMLLGEHLDAVIAQANALALAQLPAALRATVEAARRILPDAETPEGRAFHAADVIDRVTADRPAPASRLHQHGHRARRARTGACRAGEAVPRRRARPDGSAVTLRLRSPLTGRVLEPDGAARAARRRRRALAGARRHRLSPHRPRGACRRGAGAARRGRPRRRARAAARRPGRLVDRARRRSRPPRRPGARRRRAQLPRRDGPSRLRPRRRLSRPPLERPDLSRRPRPAGGALGRARHRLRTRLRHRPVPARAQPRGVACTGADVVFAKLWLARHWVCGPDVALVCCDAASPWPIADRRFDLVLCHDALLLSSNRSR